MNLKYMQDSLFEMTHKKKWTFHDIKIYWDAPVYTTHNIYQRGFSLFLTHWMVIHNIYLVFVLVGIQAKENDSLSQLV